MHQGLRLGSITDRALCRTMRWGELIHGLLDKAVSPFQQLAPPDPASTAGS